MKRANTLLCFTFFSLISILPAQDFSVVDQHATGVKRAEDVAGLAQQLTAPFDSELEKARAIFTYVATNVRYDCKEFHRDGEDRKARTYDAILERTFEKNLGVCAGYAILFDALAKEAGLNSEYVRGYARTSPRSPSPDRLRPNHAWNAVEVDGQWYLLDATWSAGYTNPEVSRFTAAFDDYFFMTPPEKFFQRHWPQEVRWQLMETEQTAEDFVAQPHFNKLQPGWRLNDYYPIEGTISDQSDEYEFRLQLTGPDKVFLTVGTRRYEMSKDADGFYTYTLEADKVRGRRFVILGLEGDRLWPLVEWRLGR